MAHVKRLDVADKWIEHGTQKELYAECGYDDVALVGVVKEMLGENRGRKSAIA